MALDFGSNADQYYVTLTNLNSWDWGSGAGTILVWFWVDADHDGADELCLLSKSIATAATRFILNWADNSEFEFFIKGTPFLQLVSSDNPVSTGKWNFGAVVWDTAGANGDQHFYYGDLTTPAAEVGSYLLQVVGSGHTDFSAMIAYVGISKLDGGIDGEFDGKIALVAAFNTAFTAAQVRQQQFSVLPILTTNCQLFVNLGFNSTGTQTDWSGNQNNGTVTSATVSNHVPLGLPVSPIFYDQPVAAVAGKTPYVFIM